MYDNLPEDCDLKTGTIKLRRQLVKNRFNCNLYIKYTGTITITTLLFVLINGCGTIKKWSNDPPEIRSFTVPKQVEYGETVVFKVRVFDPEDDALSYTWDVSDGTLLGEAGDEVQWTAPELPLGEVAPSISVKVDVYIRDGGEEDVSKSASIIVVSKGYRIGQSLSGTYELVRTQVNGDSVAAVGKMTLTATTYTRELEEEDHFSSGSYSLIEPFDERKGNIYWLADGSNQPIKSTYTWDGKLLVIYYPSTSTTYVYQK